jgi:hypothetical protein
MKKHLRLIPVLLLFSVVLLAQAPTPHQVSFVWTYTQGSDAAVSFNIYRAPGGTTSFTLLANETLAASTQASPCAPPSVPAPCYGYKDTGVTANTAYVYEVDAVDSIGNLSGPSPTATATTGGNPNVPGASSAVAN